jgi:hypothetical protein
VILGYAYIARCLVKTLEQQHTGNISPGRQCHESGRDAHLHGQALAVGMYQGHYTPLRLPGRGTAAGEVSLPPRRISDTMVGAVQPLRERIRVIGV